MTKKTNNEIKNAWNSTLAQVAQDCDSPGYQTFLEVLARFMVIGDDGDGAALHLNKKGQLVVGITTEIHKPVLSIPEAIAAIRLMHLNSYEFKERDNNGLYGDLVDPLMEVFGLDSDSLPACKRERAVEFFRKGFTHPAVAKIEGIEDIDGVRFVARCQHDIDQLEYRQELVQPTDDKDGDADDEMNHDNGDLFASGNLGARPRRSKQGPSGKQTSGRPPISDVPEVQGGG